MDCPEPAFNESLKIGIGLPADVKDVIAVAGPGKRKR
jgi:hypothetical protein